MFITNPRRAAKLAGSLILLAGCTYDTCGLESLTGPGYEVQVLCDGQARTVEIGTSTDVDDGWACTVRFSRDDRVRFGAECARGDAQLIVFCDPEASLMSSAVQLGGCSVHVWCD